MQDENFQLEKLVNQKQLANNLSYNVRTIRLWQKHSDFPKKIFGGKIFYIEEEVICWLGKFKMTQALNRITAKKKYGINSITY